MNIALIGYGKMGRAIERVALSRGHNTILRITTANKDEFTAGNLRRADVAIEFTRPDAAKDNVLQCLMAGVPVICGSTGWNEGLADAERVCMEQGTAFLHASNFSIGVNIFFEINKQLAALMNGHREYNVQIEELHHTQKKDIPSGTAITLAEQILERLSGKSRWALNDTNDPDALPVMAHRLQDYPGTHRVAYHSAVDDIEIVHTAHSREGFAAGAVLAAEFIAGKKGVFTMADVLNIK